jgi:hypothetical protein
VASGICWHQKLLLNRFSAKKELSAGIVEGLNYRVKLTIREAHTAAAPSKPPESLSITPRDANLSRNSLTDSAEEARNQKSAHFMKRGTQCP